MQGYRVLVLAGLMAAALLTSSPALALQGIVDTQGDDFVVNGRPFRFVGTNAYWMVPMSAYGARAYVDDQFTLARSLGFTVMRVFGFANGPGMGAAALQPGPGVFNEAAFRGFDYVLHKADLAGVRLLIPLTNGNPEYGGVPQYLQWCGGGTDRAFYERTHCKALYKNYVTHVLNRVNTYNGRRYKDDPAIFGWELANEPHIEHYGDRSGQVIRAWVAEMAAHVKFHDPNHLVTTGEEGYDTTSAGYSHVSAYNNQNWLFDGNKGAPWTQNIADRNIDFASIHIYPEGWNLAPHHVNLWFADHIRKARAVGKPLVAGEFGTSTNVANNLNSWLNTWQAEGGGGALVWQIMCGVCYGLRDKYGILYPPGNAVTNVLAHHASIANAGGGGGGSPSPPPPPPPPSGGGFTVGATTATPSSVAPGQTLSVASTISSGTAISGVNVDIGIWNPWGSRVAQHVVSSQTFAAGQSRSYSWAWAVPPGLAAGTYRVSVGLFNATWSTDYVWVNQADTFVVQASASAAFSAGSTTVSPNPVWRGQTVTVQTAVRATAAASGILVDMEIYDSGGRKVAQQVATGQSFAAGQTRTYTHSWWVPTNGSTGTYTVRIGVFNGNWTTRYLWVNGARSFTVR
jgi:mannan endo-1,4-beta-mannosidase